jgi:hypothetical protein
MVPAGKKRNEPMSLKKTKTTDAPKPPAAKVRVGLITGSIWERKAEKSVFYTVTFERRYKDGEGNWQTSHSYDAADILTLAKVADLTHTKIVEAQSQEAE